MKKTDLIYKDKDFEIYKKYAGDSGTVVALDCLSLIEIAITELAKWHNAGFAHKEDYESIIEDLCADLEETVK